MHKDSHTKPLHDATAQMAVDAQMQRHKWLSLQDAPTANDHDCTDAKPHTQTIALRKNYVIADIYGLCEWYKDRNDFKGGWNMTQETCEKRDGAVAYFHLPGLFEFYGLYSLFLPLFYNHREYFYDWCEIGSIYGAPADCLWGGGRVGFGDDEAEKVLRLTQKYGISARLTFSNSLIKQEHLSDRKCNRLCEMFSESTAAQNGVIICSDLLLEYIGKNYPGLYFVSSTTKVLTDFIQLEKELNREDFRFVVPDFRLNKAFDKLGTLTERQKSKVEFLCNECCYFGCTDRKSCYENVSRKSLCEDCEDFICRSPGGNEGYKFSKAMENPAFIGTDDIENTYLPMGFNQFKIEGRGLGSAVVLEFLLYYMTKSEYRLKVREEIYLDSMLDLF